MIKKPGGQVVNLSILWMIGGAFVAYTAYAAGKTALACVFAVLPVGCLLMWCGIKSAKWLVVFYLALAVIGAIGLMATKGVTVTLLASGVTAASSAYVIGKWDGGSNVAVEKSLLDE